MSDAGVVATRVSSASSRNSRERAANAPSAADGDGGQLLCAAIAALLPSNYNFEVLKTIRTIRKHGVRRVGLQLPEGLQMYAINLAGLLERFSYSRDVDVVGDANADVSGDFAAGDDGAEAQQLQVVIMGDVTYGACCIDDFTARALGCQLLVHYGHSCLVPMVTSPTPSSAGSIRTLYVFVDIRFDVDHCAQTIRHNFPARTRPVLVLISTIQFASSLHLLKQVLMTGDDHSDSDTADHAAAFNPQCGQHSAGHEPNDVSYQDIIIPQIRPLSPGEVLGCTAPRINDPTGTHVVIYLGDGRFHLESVMIANQKLHNRFYRYDPYSCQLSHERYAYADMYSMRREAIELARLPSVRHIAICQGTLGRQGSPAVVEYLQKLAAARGLHVAVVLMSELSPEKMALFGDAVDVWIQTSCPRLSIDWGYAYPKPLLTPYEATLALMSAADFAKNKPPWMTMPDHSTRDDCLTVDGIKPKTQCMCSDLGHAPNSSSAPPPITSVGDGAYPMDFYANDSMGPWTPAHISPEQQSLAREARRRKLQEWRLKSNAKNTVGR